jgi:hypothetical protein
MDDNSLPARLVAEGVVHNILETAFLLLCGPDHVNLMIVATFTCSAFSASVTCVKASGATYLALVVLYAFLLVGFLLTEGTRTGVSTQWTWPRRVLAPGPQAP